MLGFQTIEVNASDSQGKADAKIEKGIGGSNANSTKNPASNEALSVNMDWSKHPKIVLVMDKVDGMSAGDRGGIADLISSIRIFKIPIICICNDHYSQKLKSLVNYSLLLSFWKPTKQQENYVNYRPSSVGKDDNGIKRMSLIARAAESIGDRDTFNVQIRKYQQWQHSQNSAISSCISPSALLHGQRETLEQGEINFNRFSGWLGKNSTLGKNMRLLEDLHVHLLASRESNSGRGTLRIEYLTLLLKQLTEPLRVLPKDEAVQEVVDFMNTYSISQDNFDTIVELSKFKVVCSSFIGPVNYGCMFTFFENGHDVMTYRRGVHRFTGWHTIYC